MDREQSKWPDMLAKWQEAAQSEVARYNSKQAAMGRRGGILDPGQKRHQEQWKKYLQTRGQKPRDPNAMEVDSAHICATQSPKEIEKLKQEG